MDYNTIKVYNYDEVFVQLSADESIIREIRDFFTFKVPGAHFMPTYQHKVWDGTIKLLNGVNQTLYKGLLWRLANWAKENSYNIVLEEGLLETYKTQVTDEEIETFIKSLNLKLTPHNHQLEAFKKAVRQNRLVLKSPTSSGKSLIIYMLCMWNIQNNRKILITVPTVNLVVQLAADFKSYSDDFDINNVNMIYDGKSKGSQKAPIFISTWQSIYQEKKSFFDQFNVVITDEVHTAKAKSLKGILEKCKEIRYRYGLTGTLDGTDCNELVIEGLFGKVYVVTTTKELMDKKIVADLTVNCLVCNHTDVRTKYKDYQDEIKFLSTHTKRNRLIAELAISQNKKEENVLILVDRIEHMDLLKAFIKDAYIVCGKVSADDREEIRQLAEKHHGITIIATSQTMSTGTSIKNLQHLIFGTPGKSLIKILQSIGRALRLDGKTNSAIVWDISDNINKSNYTYRHFFERIKIYTQEKYNYKIKKIDL